MITIQDLATAIMKAEGGDVSGSVPNRANNPGDLKLGDLGQGTINGVTVFPDFATGFAALQKQVGSMVDGSSKYYDPSQTLADVGNTYSGGDPNWAKNVANFLGVTPDTTLGDAAKANAPMSMSDILKKIPLNPIGGMSVPDNTSSPDAKQQSPWILRGSMIGIGLLLIAAGVFSFKQTQVVIQSGARLAKYAA